MRLKLSSLFIVFLLFSCSTEPPLEQLPISPLLHDGNSKVWMVEKIVQQKRNFAPLVNMEKDIIVFYENGRCMVQPMSTLGDIVGKKGEYAAYAKDSSLTIYFKNERWDFNIKIPHSDTFILFPTKESDLKYKMILVPFPEF